MIVGGSSQGISGLDTSILKVVSIIPFVRCGRLINYMFFPLYLYTYNFIFIVIYYYNLFVFIYNTYMFNIYWYYNYFNI